MTKTREHEYIVGIQGDEFGTWCYFIWRGIDLIEQSGPIFHNGYAAMEAGKDRRDELEGSKAGAGSS